MSEAIDTMPILDHFGILAPLYETFILPKEPQALWNLAELPVSGALLDAGGGTGRVAQHMHGRADSVVVADLSFRMLAEAQKKDGLLPVCSHTETLPFPDKSFARIIMVDAFHHVCDQRTTVDELWRLLQPGGILVIEEPDIRSFGVKLVAVAEKLALMRSHFLSPQNIMKLFQFPHCHVRVEREGYTAWIIARKEH